MKKMIILAMLITSVISGFTQNWEKINFPSNVSLTASIYRGDTAIVFGGGKVFWINTGNWMIKDKKVCAWQKSSLPTNETVKKCVKFKNKFFALTDHFLLESYDGVDWGVKFHPTNYTFLWCCANKTNFFLFPYGMAEITKTSDGENFVPFYDLMNFLGYWEDIGVIKATCLGDTILAIDCAHGLYASRSLISLNNGVSWSWLDSFDNSFADIADINSQYKQNHLFFDFDLVGTDRGVGLTFFHFYNDDYLNFSNFNAGYGRLLTTCYWYSPGPFEIECWVGGYIFESPYNYTIKGGIIMCEKIFSTILFVEYPVRSMASGENSAIAVGDNGQIYASINPNNSKSLENSSVKKDTTAGIFNNNSSNLVLPNPTTGLIHINIGEEQEVLIYDLLGRKLNSIKLPSGIHKIDLSEYNTGTYLVSGKGWQEKVIKQ